MRLYVFPALLLALACKTESKPSPASAPPAPATAVPSANPHAAPGSASSALTPRTVEAHPLEKLPEGRVALGPFSLQVPEGWTEKPSTSSMRAVEFLLPSKDGDAEVIVYYFGASGAGSVQANIDRWVSQFKQPDDKPSSEVAKVEQAQFAGQRASLVSVSGRYVSAGMPGSAPIDKPDQALLAAIVPSPRGPYYFRLIGDRAAVEAHAPKFRAALESLQLK